ncbi:MAG: DUF1700 domain-containing protein [Oscillospiraceae bacterium]|nr:DUF1700 domain-containing protein [Oscillospiraceae bacterium]
MDKREFLKQLRKGLSGLSRADITERVSFYTEMIDDYMEEGLSEEEAIQRIGTVNEITFQILADASPVPKKHNSWKIAAIILGSPIWLSLLISVLAVALSLYASLWAVVISLWSVFGALCSCFLAGILSGAVFAATGYIVPGVAMIGAGLVCAGLSVFVFYGCKAASKGAVLLIKKAGQSIKSNSAKRRVQNA